MKGDNFDWFPLFDWERSACLCDVGAPGHSVAVAVTDDGRDTLWMVNDAELNAEHPRCGNGDQPHEQVGPLPPDVRARVDQVHTRRDWPRCGRPTHAGTPCHQRVKATGQACGQHSARAAP
jgi:hypothetical protein